MSSDKKICIATGIFPPDKGGPAQFASAFSSWLTKKGVATSIISLTDNATSHTNSDFLTIDLISRKSGIPSRMLKTSNLIRKKSSSSKLLINGLFLETLLASFTKQIDYIAKIPGDIVWERARNTGSTNLDIDEFQGNEPIQLRAMRWAFTKSLKRARQIISPSLHLVKLMSGWGIDESKVVVIPNGVDTEIFKPDINAEKIYDLITVSRLVEWKGIKELIEAADQLACRLLIVGSGPQESELRQLAAKSKGIVEFAGEIEQSQLPKLINSSRFFVLNSKYEGSPHSLIEAMSCGALVIARASTGTKELIESGVDGVLVLDHEKLANVLKSCIGDQKTRLNMGVKAREKILRNYSREKIFSDIYRLTVQNK